MKQINDVLPLNNLPDGWVDLPLHELCDAFPAMGEEDYDNLVNSMKIHGFLASDPIVLLNITPDAPDPTWEILDGRNRLIAAIDAHITEPEFVYYNGSNPVAFVVAKNLDRRHLTTGQKAAVASNLANLASGEHSDVGMTQAEAAIKVGVGEATVRRYKYVEKHDPELAEQVKKGEVPLETARVQVKAKIKPPVEEIIKPTLGDKKAERRAEQKIALTEHIKSVTDRLIDSHDLDESARDALTTAFTEGYLHCKQGH